MAYETTRTQIQLQAIEGGANWYPTTDAAFVLGLEDWLNDKKYVTETKLQDYVSSELGDYVSSDDLESTLSDYVLSSDLTDELKNYYTKTDADDKFLTEHQSLDNYALKSYVDSAIETSEKKIFGDGELKSAFDTIKEIGDYLDSHEGAYQTLLAKVNGKLDTSTYEEDKETFALKSNTYTKTEVYNKTEIDGLFEEFDISDQLENYYTKEESYSSSEVDQKISEAIDALKKLIGVKATTTITQ